MGYIARGEAAGLGLFGVLGSEYRFMEQMNVLYGLIDTFAVLYPAGLPRHRNRPFRGIA